MRIEVKEGTASVYTPYNTDFVSAVRSIGGACWNRSQQCWDVPSHSVDAVRNIMMEVYGETDAEPADKVDIRVTFTESIFGDRGPVTLFGKTVASAFGRDSGAKVGDDVAFILKKPASGGSVKYWKTVIPEGAVAEVYNVPRSKAVGGEGYTVEVIEKDRPDTEVLRKEKEKLLKRLEEIDALLGEA